MDKFNNSNSSLALQKFYSQQNNDIRLLELQQRLKTEQIQRHIEMIEVINEEPGPPTVSSDAVKVVVEEQVINEEKVVVEEQGIIEEQQEQEQNQKLEESNQQEPLNGESLEEIYYQSNENFEIEKPVTLERTKSTIINQTKINNLIKLKKW